MNNPYSLLAPGPVNLHPKVREILADAMIHHRTPAFDDILKRVLNRLPQIFQTKNPVLTLTSTGSGGMEALMLACLNQGDQILVINSGKFGERWFEMAKVFGFNVIEYKVTWGEAADPLQVSQIIKANPELKAIFTQACETSTAVKHPLKELAQLTKDTDILFFVDGITALGAYDIPMDSWGIDGIVAGSQKAFMLPTGMCFIALSERAWNRAKTSNITKFYFNLNLELAANRKGETWFSSNVAIIKALDVVLDLILAQGLNRHFAEIQKRADFTYFMAQKLGLKLFANSPSPSVTALLVPTAIDGQLLRANLESQYNITLMGGQDQLKGKIIRIGHMGYISSDEMIRLALSLQELLQKMGHVVINPFTENELQNWWK